MGCFCAVQEEFYCEVLLLDETKLTLTTQQQGIKVSKWQYHRHLSPENSLMKMQIISRLLEM